MNELHFDNLIDLQNKYEHYFIDPQITDYLKKKNLKHLIMSEKSKYT